MSRVTLALLENDLEHIHCFLLKLILVGPLVDPASQSLSIQIARIVFKQFLNLLASLLELLNVAQESGSAENVTVRSGLFPLIELEHIDVNGILVDVSAPLVVVDESVGGREGALTPILNLGELSDGLVDVAFVENTETLPENQDGVHSFFQFVVDEDADLAPEFLSDEVVDVGDDLLHGSDVGSLHDSIFRFEPRITSLRLSLSVSYC
jgi:hypothetical protein